MSKNKTQKLELKMGPIRQELLPEGFIERVRKYKEILKEVETSSLEETVSNFQRDLLPERELKIWEKIASHYELKVKNNPSWGISKKKELFAEVLRSTM